MYAIKYYRTEFGEKTVLVGPKGRKYMPVLMIESSGLSVKKVPLTESRYMREVQRKFTQALVKQYRAIGRRLGMSKAAKTFLTNAQKAAQEKMT